MKRTTLKHSRLFIVLAVVFLAACTTTPEQRAADEQRRIAQREADQQRREAEEQKRSVQREADARRRAPEEQRRALEREANERRHEADERRHAEEDLRRKFARYSTGELKLMDTRYKELKQSSGRDLNVRVNAGETNSDARNIERVLEIERELMRRWKSGDAQAYLPEFEPSAPESKK